MARGSVGAGLPTVSVPVYVGGALDTKTNPKLVQPGALLELENMTMSRTGEMRLRNGFASLSASVYPTGGLSDLYAGPRGVLHAIATNLNNAGTPYTPVKYNNAGSAPGWQVAQPSFQGIPLTSPMPIGLCAITGIEASQSNPAAANNDLSDPDFALGTGFGGLSSQMATWMESTLAANGQRYSIRALNGAILDASQTGTLNASTRPAIAVAAGTLVLMFAVNGIGGIKYSAFNSDTGSLAAQGTIAAGTVSIATPWVDAKLIPGTSNIAIGFRASAGGVTCGIFNTGTFLFGTIVNTAGADASMCVGWLDDSLATGNMYFATAGSASGVVVRTMSAATMVVSATNVIDAAATANVRQITGHINTNATNYVVLWEVENAATTYLSKVRRGTWTGAATVADLAPSLGLYSRSFKMADGRYYFVGSYDSTTQATYFLVSSDTSGLARRFDVMAIIMPGFAGGRRANACSLSSVTVSGASAYVALARKQKLTTSNGVVLSLRAIVRGEITVSASGLTRPRELGGTFFFPGGVICRDDGKLTNWAVDPLTLESPTLVSSATGSMTPSGSYAFRLVLKRTDAVGRISRSAASIPVSVTLGAGDGRVTLTIQNPRMCAAAYSATILETYAVEVYRAGPAEALDSTYNKVGELSSDQLGAADTLTFIDSMSDANAELGESAYFTGQTAENFPAPSCNLLEVNGGRVGIVNGEYPTEVWVSKEYKPGLGLGMNPLFAFRCEGDNRGPITALGSMDGRWVCFKDASTWVVSGDGPNDANQGSFASPQAVSRTVGVQAGRAASVVETPDGIMFQSQKGIYLLDRGLGVSYIGKEVEIYTQAAGIVGASLVSGTTTARFVFASGRMLEWDYHHKRWYTHQLRVGASTVVGCANSSTLGWCYALADGTVMAETPGVYSDVMGTSTAIVPRISFPHLNLAGINGYQRVRAIQVLVDVVGNHTLAIDAEYDYSGAVTGTARTIALTVATPSFEAEYNPPEGKAKCTSIRPVLTASVLASGSGAFRLAGLSVQVAVKRRGTNVPATSRMT
jgi:hypothetical protein